MNENRVIILRRLGISFVVVLVVTVALILLLSMFREQMGAALFSLLAGSLGAGVSLARRLPSLGERELGFLAGSRWNIVVPLLVGGVMAGFLYIVFMGGLLTGDGGGGLFTSNLFPNFTRPSVQASALLDLNAVLQIRPASVQDFGKLIAWCFLSGYSERFVPNLLDSLERQGSKKA